MSTTSPTPLGSPTIPSSITSTSHHTSVGLGYGIAIAVSILVLISSVMLASYACVRVQGSGRHASSSSSDDDDEDNDHVDDGDRGRERSNGPNRPSVSGLPGPMVVKVCWDKQPKKGVAFPEVVLGESKRLPKPNNGPCSICLSDYKAKETIRCMPDCNHCFHVDCIDQWLRMSPTCPLCRNSPAPSTGPTPVSTPLSELVPLAFHPR